MVIRRPAHIAADLPVPPLRAGETKQQWVYRQLVDAIHTRILGPGEGVPSTRALAVRLGIARGVVELAYEQLISEGYLVAEVGRGTRVGADHPQRFLRAAASPAADASVNRQPESPQGVDAPSPLTTVHPTRAGQPFIARLPDVQSLDLRSWKTCIARASRELDPANLGDADPRGLEALRVEISKHLAFSRGLRCEPHQVMVVTGIRHAIDLCTQVAVRANGGVALEDPGYPGARAIFRLRERRTVDIPIDDEGISVVALRKARVDMAYITPAHQAPSGVALSARRREELLEWAQATGAWILEDDYDSDFSYESAPLPALKSQDRRDRVIFCGSFNKSLFPGLRIGYIVAPAPLLPSLLEARACTGRANPVLDQLALAGYMRTGTLLRHLKKARVAYKARRDLVVRELLEAGCQPEHFQGLHAGFHFVLRLPNDADEDRLIADCANAGLLIQSLRSFWSGATQPPPPALVIGYTALSDPQARWSARQLGLLLRDGLQPTAMFPPGGIPRQRG